MDEEFLHRRLFMETRILNDIRIAEATRLQVAHNTVLSVLQRRSDRQDILVVDIVLHGVYLFRSGSVCFSGGPFLF